MRPEENYKNLVSKAKEITDLDITYTRSRRYEIVLIKSSIVNVLSRYFGYTTVTIGELMNLHHSTVIHHLRKHNDRYRYEDEYMDLYDELSKYTAKASDAPIDAIGIISTLRACLSV